MAASIRSRPDAAKTIETRDILGVRVADADHEAACDLILDAIDTQQLLRIAFLNAHNANMAQADPALNEGLKLFTVFADGLGVDIAARMIYGSKFRQNMNGTDFVPGFLTGTMRPLKVALWGGRPGIAQKAADALSIMAPQHEILVASHGFPDAAAEALALDRLASDRPDIVIVCMGTPHQEKWVLRNLSGRHCSVAITAGALFDFLAHEVARAPAWMRMVRSEWVFRLAQEPQRLWKRYLYGNPLFMSYVLREKLTAMRRARARDLQRNTK